MDNSDDDVLTDQSCVDVVTLATRAQRWPIPYESSNYISLYPSLVEKTKLIIAYWYFSPNIDIRKVFFAAMTNTK